MAELDKDFISRRLKKLREKHNMTQGDVCRATGYERSYISALENEKISYPRLQTIHRIATKAFKMTISEFLKENETE